MSHRYRRLKTCWLVTKEATVCGMLDAGTQGHLSSSSYTCGKVCAVVVRPLVGLNVLLFLFREQEKDGERWSEREGGGCEGTSTNPTMLKDTPNKHLIYYVPLSYSENITIPEIFHTVIYL